MNRLTKYEWHKTPTGDESLVAVGPHGDEILLTLHDPRAIEDPDRLLADLIQDSYERDDWERQMQRQEKNLPPLTPAELEALQPQWYEQRLYRLKRFIEMAPQAKNLIGEAAMLVLISIFGSFDRVVQHFNLKRSSLDSIKASTKQ